MHQVKPYRLWLRGSHEKTSEKSTATTQGIKTAVRAGLTYPYQYTSRYSIQEANNRNVAGIRTYLYPIALDHTTRSVHFQSNSIHILDAFSSLLIKPAVRVNIPPPPAGRYSRQQQQPPFVCFFLDNNRQWPMLPFQNKPKKTISGRLLALLDRIGR